MLFHPTGPSKMTWLIIRNKPGYSRKKTRKLSEKTRKWEWIGDGIAWIISREHAKRKRLFGRQTRAFSLMQIAFSSPFFREKRTWKVEKVAAKVVRKVIKMQMCWWKTKTTRDAAQRPWFLSSSGDGESFEIHHAWVSRFFNSGGFWSTRIAEI